MAIQSARAKQKLEIRKAILDEHCSALFEDIRKACGRFDEERARISFEKLMNLNDVSKVLADVMDVFNQEQKDPIYSAGSLFLYDCYKYLMQVPQEVIHYVTGVDLGGILTLDKMTCFDIEKQSAVYVKGNIVSSQKVLIQMTEYGHKLHGWFHSHPGRGVRATVPSTIDMDHQARLERGNYPSIGAIFTRDGFVRFFSGERRFEVTVYGEGVEKVNERIYRLTKVGKVRKR